MIRQTIFRFKIEKTQEPLTAHGGWRAPVAGCGYQMAETVHTMNETKRAFRLIIKREVRRRDLFEEIEGPYF